MDTERDEQEARETMRMPEIWALLQRGFSQLDRVIVLLMAYEGMSAADAAKRLHLNRSVVADAWDSVMIRVAMKLEAAKAHKRPADPEIASLQERVEKLERSIEALREHLDPDADALLLISLGKFVEASAKTNTGGLLLAAAAMAAATIYRERFEREKAARVLAGK